MTYWWKAQSLYPEDGGNKVLKNIALLLQNCIQCHNPGDVDLYLHHENLKSLLCHSFVWMCLSFSFIKLLP